MTEQFITTTDGTRLWTEAFGSPGDAPVLLIMGLASQALLWPEELCRGLADRQVFVIRFDSRDTGRSTTFDFATHPYTAADMVDDVIAVLDGYGLQAAHLVGASMGGIVAQMAALRHPDRVLSLTSLMSSPGGGQSRAADLPGPSAAITALAMKRLTDPPSTVADQIELMVESFRASAGTLAAFDEPAMRALAERCAARCPDLSKANNHMLMAAGHAGIDNLQDIAAPTLVIHGTADPVLPLEHGEATAREIPGAILTAIDGLGHELPPAAHAEIIDAITRHIRTAGSPT